MEIEKFWFECKCGCRFDVDSKDILHLAACPDCGADTPVDQEATVAYQGGVKRSQAKILEMVNDCFHLEGANAEQFKELKLIRDQIEFEHDLEKLVRYGEEIREWHQKVSNIVPLAEPELSGQLAYFIFHRGGECIGRSIEIQNSELYFARAQAGVFSDDRDADGLVAKLNEDGICAINDGESQLFSCALITESTEHDKQELLIQMFFSLSNCQTDRDTVFDTITSNLPCTLVIAIQPESQMAIDRRLQVAWSMVRVVSSSLYAKSCAEQGEASEEIPLFVYHGSEFHAGTRPLFISEEMMKDALEGNLKYPDAPPIIASLVDPSDPNGYVIKDVPSGAKLFHVYALMDDQPHLSDYVLTLDTWATSFFGNHGKPFSEIFKEVRSSLPCIIVINCQPQIPLEENREMKIAMEVALCIGSTILARRFASRDAVEQGYWPQVME